jgi:cyclophilin family peptidyl-prolyl cis-trans isomerase
MNSPRAYALALKSAAEAAGLAARGRVSTSASRHSRILPVSTATSSFIVTNSVVPQQRSFATGTRGSRGHGWYVNYRAGKGGRHLQGEYFDRDDAECREWNDAIFALGSQQVYLDIVAEPRSAVSLALKRGEVPPMDSLTGEKHRLLIEIASAAMPETTENFISLCQAEADGYTGTLLYRIEPGVGISGGDVLTNIGKAGMAAAGTPMDLTIKDDPLALWHTPGTVSMVVHRVDEIDSRFILCTASAHHLDGMNRAFGRMTAESIAVVKGWQDNLLTKNGAPASCDLIVVGSGLVGEEGAEKQVA